jgi:hypothetical protein
MPSRLDSVDTFAEECRYSAISDPFAVLLSNVNLGFSKRGPVHAENWDSRLCAIRSLPLARALASADTRPVILEHTLEYRNRSRLK